MKSVLAAFGARASRAMFIAFAAIAVLSVVSLISPATLKQADAAVTNYPPGVQVYAMPMQLAGAYTASSSTAVKFNMPYAARLIGFGGAARTLSGTIAVDLQAGGVSLLSAPLTLSTAYGEATIATSAIADEASITAVVTTTGAGATVADITILPTFLRR